MSINTVEIRAFSGPATVELAGVGVPEIVEVRQGPPGPNSVTSATTSDGTAALDVLSLHAVDSITATDEFGYIATTGVTGLIYTTGANAEIYTSGANAHIGTRGGGYVETSTTFRLNDGQQYTTLSHAPTANRSIALPDASGTIALTSDIVDSVTSATTSDGTADLSVNTITSNISVNIADNGVDPVVSMTINGFSVGATTLGDGNIYLSKGLGTGSFIQTTNVTSVRTFELPNASGTIALTTSNVATATALETSRNIFGIAFNGTANVSGDATNTGHFASIPAGGQAGHFITLNGTAPTVIAGRSAWWSDSSGNPSFRNGTGAAVTLVRSSDLGTGVATALAVNTGSAGAFVVNGGALGTPSSGTLTSCTGLPISTGVSGLAANVATFLATPSSANLAAAVTDETGNGSLVFAQNSTLSGTTLTSLERNTLGRIAALTMSQSPPCSLFEDFCGTSGAGIYTWTNSGTGSDSIGATGQNCFGVRRMTTGTTSGNQRKTILPIPTSTIFGTEIRAHFAIPDVTTCDAFIGMEQTSGAFGRYFLLYAAALNSGRWILLTGTGAGVFTNFGTNGPSNGNFASGKRYRSIMRVINATTVYVKIDEADWNADNWSNLHDANVTITSYTPSADPMALDIRVNTQTNAARSLDIDYISVENTSIVR